MSNPAELGARIAAFTWDRNRARRLFLVHFPLALLHLPLALVFVGLLGFALFGYFALRSFRRWRNTKPVFEIHEHGFVDRRGALPLRHRHEVLADYGFIDRILRFPFPLSFVQLHGVALTAKVQGKHFVVNEHFADVRRCIALLQEGIVRQRLPVVRTLLARNETLRFGPLRMNAIGLQLGKRTLGWQSFGGLRLGTWRIGRRSEPALQILDTTGRQWDIIVRNGCTDAALFVLLCAEHRPSDNTTALLESFCGLKVERISSDDRRDGD